RGCVQIPTRTEGGDRAERQRQRGRRELVLLSPAPEIRPPPLSRERYWAKGSGRSWREHAMESEERRTADAVDRLQQQRGPAVRKGTPGVGKKRPMSPASGDAPNHEGWSTSVAERLRVPSGGGGGGGDDGGDRHRSRPTPKGSIGGSKGNGAGQDEAMAAAAMHALATSATSSPSRPPPSSSSSSSSSSRKDGGGDIRSGNGNVKKVGGDKKRPPAKLGPPAEASGGSGGGRGFSGGIPPLSPAEQAKIRKGNLGRILPSGNSGTGGGGGAPPPSSSSKRGPGKGKDGSGDAAKMSGGKKQQGGNGGGGGVKGRGRGDPQTDEEDESSESEAVKRKAAGGSGRKTKKSKAHKDERLSSVEAAVPETGGDLSSPPAVSPFPNWAEDSDEMVGSRVRVYWDGDNEWYSGRIVRFKTTQPKPYLVRYDEDGSVEWMNLPKEPAIVARQVVWVKMRSHPWWPAQVYQPTGPKAMQDGMIEVKERHAFVVFFKTDESGFVPVGQNVIQSFASRQDLLHPVKKPSKGLEKAIIAAKAELRSMAEASKPSTIESYAKEDRDRPRETVQPPSKKPKVKKDGASGRSKKGDGSTSQRVKKGDAPAASGAAAAAAAVSKPKKSASGAGAGGSRPKKEDSVSKQAGPREKPSGTAGVPGSGSPRAPAAASARSSAPPPPPPSPSSAPAPSTSAKKLGGGLPSAGQPEGSKKKKAVSPVAGGPGNLDKASARAAAIQPKKSVGAAGGKGSKKKKPLPAGAAAVAPVVSARPAASTKVAKGNVSKPPAAPTPKRAEGPAGPGPPAQVKRKPDAVPAVVVPPMLQTAPGGGSSAAREFPPRREGGPPTAARRPEGGINRQSDSAGGVSTPVLKRLEASLGLMVGSSAAKRAGPAPSASRGKPPSSHPAAAAKLPKRPPGGAGAPPLDRPYPGPDLAHPRAVGNHLPHPNRPSPPPPPPPSPSSFGGAQKIAGGGGG
ncbi:unnamed protein product, partial [Scytosiphon promiscuus]